MTATLYLTILDKHSRKFLDLKLSQFSILVRSVTLGLTLFLGPALKADEKGKTPELTFVERATDFTLRHHVGSSVRLNVTNPSLQENIKPSAAPFPPDNPPFFVIPPELKTTVVD